MLPRRGAWVRKGAMLWNTTGKGYIVSYWEGEGGWGRTLEDGETFGDEILFRNGELTCRVAPLEREVFEDGRRSFDVQERGGEIVLDGELAGNDRLEPHVEVLVRMELGERDRRQLHTLGKICDADVR